MKASHRVLINTLAQYSRTIINMLLSLYTVKVLISALGVSDYGIYTLIAGVVSMLGFVTNSLVETTQRFVSYYQGVGSKQTLRIVFNNSLVIHIILGIVVSLVLLCFLPLLFDGFLNIPIERLEVAKLVYMTMVFILFTTFIASPFRALLISHENIVYISIIDVLDGVLKVVAVLFMAMSSYDKLLLYSFIMLAIQIFNFFALSIYCYAKYDECGIPSLKNIERKYVSDLFSFAGWKIFGTLCVVGRQQGMSIVYNRFLGTPVNAGFGIGNQLSGYTSFLSSAIVNAMAPQIVKAEGCGDRERATWLSNILSKLNFFLMSIIGIPMVFEAQSLLKLWLGDVPEYSSLFCVTFVVGLLFDSLTIGLTHINNAVGKIKKYMICMGIPKLMTVAFVYLALVLDYPLSYSCAVFVIIEALASILRIFLIHEQIGLSIREYIIDVILKSLFPALLCVGICLICVIFLDWTYRFLLTFSVSAILYSISMYFCGFNNIERDIINRIAIDLRNKLAKR